MKNTIERKIENTKNQKGENGMKKMVVYEHDCMSAARYHKGKYKHWAKLLTNVDETKSNGYAFMGEWLSKDVQVQVPEGAIVVEYRGCEGKQYHLYRMGKNGKEEITASSREELVGFIRVAAEVLKKQKEDEQKEIEKQEEREMLEVLEGEEKDFEKEMSEEKRILKNYIEREVMDKGFDRNGQILINVAGITLLDEEEIVEIVENLELECEKVEGFGNFLVSLPKKFKEEEEKMKNEKERRALIDFIETEIMDKGFDEDGDFLINVSDVTNFSDEKIIEVVENLGLCCEKAEGDGTFWISLPEEYILPHQNLMEIYFDNQGPMTDDEMIEVLDYYINAHRKELEEFGCIALDTSRWSYVDIEQIERVAGYLHFDCHCKGYEEEDWDGYIHLYPWK